MSNTNFKKILVALDDSENSKRALKTGIALAKNNDASIVAIFVLPFPAVQAYQPNKAAKEQMYKEGKRFLSSAKKEVENQGLFFESKILEGNPGSAIVDFAKSPKNKVDLIVIGSRGRSGVKELFLGSVSHFVMHKSKVPVLLVK